VKQSWDAIVVGGGHNGLACAAYLARAGRSVLVLEKRHVLGGAAVSEEVFPGFTYSVCSYDVSLLRPWIIRDLDLPRHGLEIIPLEAAFSPYPDGRALCRWSDPELTRREIAAFSKQDSEVYPQFGKLMTQLSRFVQPLIDAPAPRPTSLDPRELLGLARQAGRFRELGSEQRAALLELGTKSAADLLDEWFESDQLKAPMSVSGIIGTFLGVRSPGTAYVLLHHYMGKLRRSHPWSK
jgi:phytoene dehydrogenase-like protein